MWPAQVLRHAEARLLVIATLVVGALNAPRQVNDDTWFNLVLGREIATYGLIHHNDLTREAWGAPVVDLQWLAHWLQYWLVQGIGLPGLVLVGSLLAYGTLLAAARCALGAGATPGRTLFVGLLALASFAPQAVRAHTFALPLLLCFVVTLGRDVERPARRSWWLLPCAALWGNLHGSALLAPALGAIALAARALDARRAQRPVDVRWLVRDAALTLGLSAGVVASPYGLGLLGYYASTLYNPAFRAHLVEWRGLELLRDPLTSVLPLCCFVLVLLGSRNARSFPVLVCSFFALLTLLSIRHATPLAIVAAALLPAMADAACGEHLRFAPDRVLRALTGGVLPLACLVFLAAVPLLAARALPRDTPVAFSDRVAAAAAGAGEVLADEHHADRLLWYHPELKGRLSHDVRLEILPLRFIEALSRAYGLPGSEGSRRWLSRYDLVIVDREAHGPLWASLDRDPGWREIAADRFATAFQRLARAEPGANGN